MFRVATFQAREKGSRGTPPKRDVAEVAERPSVGRAALGFSYIKVNVSNIYWMKLMLFQLLCTTFCLRSQLWRALVWVVCSRLRRARKMATKDNAPACVKGWLNERDVKESSTGLSNWTVCMHRTSHSFRFPQESILCYQNCVHGLMQAMQMMQDLKVSPSSLIRVEKPIYLIYRAAVFSII